MNDDILAHHREAFERLRDAASNMQCSLAVPQSRKGRAEYIRNARQAIRLAQSAMRLASKERREYHRLSTQAKALRKAFPESSTEIQGGVLTWRGLLNPCPLCATYEVELRYALDCGFQALKPELR